ncbi:MAG: Lrp/AsnC family transcriptional regulator [Nanoarchaeota archaeon]|nr:Lrp/AsnC family transcriptional regulator [Nanoarchaeota archaeon]
MKPQELKILQELRKNSRRSLTDISDSTGIPLSTVFKKVSLFEKSLVKKYVTLIDFNTLGLNIRISLVLKSKDRESLKKFLSAHKNVNSLYRISPGFDFFVETIFPNMLEFENFVEEINDLVIDKKVFHIIEDLRKEDFAIIKDERAK